MGTRLSSTQLAAAANGEASFFGEARTQEVHDVVDELIRWPNYKGLISMRREVLQHEASASSCLQ